MQTFHWDFFGPPARARAMHFLGHLKETLRNWKLAESAPGLASDSDGHHSVFLRVENDSADRLREILRPNRVTENDD